MHAWYMYKYTCDMSCACTYPRGLLHTTQGIGMGFRRREQALRDLSEVPSYTLYALRVRGLTNLVLTMYGLLTI